MTEDLTPGMRRREAWLIGLLRFGVVLTVAMAAYNAGLMLFLHWSETGAFSSNAAQDDYALRLDLAGGVIGVSFLAFFIGSIIAYGLWVMRAVNLAKLRAPQIMTISPRWAFAWNVIPIASLWMPLKAVAQIWRAGGAGDPNEPLPGVFYLWWLSWIATNILGQASWRVGGLQPSFEELKITSRLDLAGDVLMLVACYGLIKVVRMIQARQGAFDQEKVAAFE